MPAGVREISDHVIQGNAANVLILHESAEHKYAHSQIDGGRRRQQYGCLNRIPLVLSAEKHVIASHGENRFLSHRADHQCGEQQRKIFPLDKQECQHKRQVRHRVRKLADIILKADRVDHRGQQHGNQSAGMAGKNSRVTVDGVIQQHAEQQPVKIARLRKPPAANLQPSHERIGQKTRSVWRIELDPLDHIVLQHVLPGGVLHVTERVRPVVHVELVDSVGNFRQEQNQKDQRQSVARENPAALSPVYQIGQRQRDQIAGDSAKYGPDSGGRRRSWPAKKKRQANQAGGDPDRDHQ